MKSATLSSLALVLVSGCTLGTPLPGGFTDTPPGGGPPPTPDACSSGAWWTAGNEESPVMHPGGDCISCHRSGEGPRFTSAGTVMTGLADNNDCMGAEGVTVRLLDNQGRLLVEMLSNAAGNFSTGQALPADRLPFTVDLVANGRTTHMVSPQQDANCMSCHTKEGRNGAPGRIVAP